MDNSILTLRQRTDSLLEAVKRFRDALEYHVVKGPHNELEAALHYGLPEDIYLRYYGFLKKNEIEVNDILADIDQNLIRYLENVKLDLDKAVNLE